MSENRRVNVKVPGSTANLGPGFDSIGMAFQLYTSITVQFSEKPQIELFGKAMEGLPKDKSNLIYRTMEKLFKLAGEPLPTLHLTIESQIPLTRGLGSSAAAIVGGLVAANQLLKHPFSQEKIYHIASEIEGHPDNTGASMFGGIVVATLEQEVTPFIKLNPPQSLKAVMVIPDFPLFTHKARSVLPECYSRKDVVHSISHSSLLIGALASGQMDLLKYAMQDRIHQPYRASLVPGMERLLSEATNHGALGAALSGAGPTVLALTEDGEVEKLKDFMKNTLDQHGVPCETVTLAPDVRGVQVAEEYIDMIPNP